MCREPYLRLYFGRTRVIYARVFVPYRQPRGPRAPRRSQARASARVTTRRKPNETREKLLRQPEAERGAHVCRAGRAAAVGVACLNQHSSTLFTLYSISHSYRTVRHRVPELALSRVTLLSRPITPATRSVIHGRAESTRQ